MLEDLDLARYFVDQANWVYGKDNPYWNCPSNDDIQDPNDDWYQVVRDFVCEAGPEPHEFKDNAFITKSLKETSFIRDARFRYYTLGQDHGKRSFNPIQNFNPFFENPEFMPAFLIAEIEYWTSVDPAGTGRILGGFSYIIEERDSYLYWTVTNLMSRESGTRILYGDLPSLEEQVNSGQTTFFFRSILQSKSRLETRDPEGGGDMRMIITWKEFHNPCHYNNMIWIP